MSQNTNNSRGSRVRGMDIPQAIMIPSVASAEAGFKDSVVDTYGALKDSTKDKSAYSSDDTDKKTEDNERKILTKKPFINVIPKADFDKRVEEVFGMMGAALARSYGPYGATTLISQYPNYHITKDGYTIAKNLAFDKTSSFVDQIICGLACDICGRLNYSVGDGTTTAVVATNSIFKAYRSEGTILKEHRFLPRDIMRKFTEIKDYVINYLLTNAVSINVMDKDELADYIAKIVFVSSNGDQEMTDIISSLYREMKYPSIDVRIAEDGITKKKIVNGFRIGTSLTDVLYVNNDNKTMELGNSDVIVFDHKITLDTYEKTLKPLNDLSRNRGRHLICIAPFYDESAINTKIAHELKVEYQQNKDINLVLMVCKNTSAHHKKMINNLAMLLNTEIITRERCMDINAAMDQVLTGQVDATYKFPFNIDNRNIPESVIMTADRTLTQFDPETMNEDSIMMKSDPDVLRLGYVSGAVLGLKESTFTGFYYDQNTYNAYLLEAESDLEEAEKKYQKLATFNIEIDQCQERLNGLNMNIGVIEVGSDSQFAQSYLKDQVDDCVRASKSAYKYGIIDGCSVSVIRGLDDYAMSLDLNNMSMKEVYLTQGVYNIFREGFANIYKTLINNMGIDTNIALDDIKAIDLANVRNTLCEMYGSPDGTFDFIAGINDIKDFIETEDNENFYLNTEDIIIEHCAENPVVFDLTTGEFTNNIINSAETDIQILRATSDLIKLLITGNQLVVSTYTQFQ